MEKLTLQLTLLHKSLKTLQDSFVVCKKAKAIGDQALILATEDSIIQRFEYTFDSFWKTLKKYLEITYKLQDANSPKNVFRYCIRYDLCPAQDGEKLIKMADDRNTTTHTYDLEEAKAILPNIQHYYQLMTTIINRIQKSAS